jgi:asparagine synthase (glutamine-hydrolysing)
MCGISGLVNCGDAETLARMTNVQTHRGPDDSGLWERHFPDGGYVGLGSRRLAILDLSAEGRMPMSNSAQRTCRQGTSFSIVYGHRSHRSSVRRIWRGLFGSLDWDVCVRDL